MHNAGVASLAQDDDWNFIANQTGDASWEASKMVKYLKEIESNQYRPTTDQSHGFKGRATHTNWIPSMLTEEQAGSRRPSATRLGLKPTTTPAFG